MTELRFTYDMGRKSLIVRYENKLIGKYFEDLCNIMSKQNLPENTEIEEISSNSCNLVIPFDPKMAKIDSRGIQLPTGITNSVTTGLIQFVEHSFKSEFNKLEIIPLSGYPVKDIKEDIKLAIKAQRNFCVIDKMSSFKNFTEGKTTSLNQAIFEYMSDDWCDITLAAINEDIKSIKKIAKGKLELVTWGK